MLVPEVNEEQAWRRKVSGTYGVTLDEAQPIAHYSLKAVMDLASRDRVEALPDGRKKFRHLGRLTGVLQHAIVDLAVERGMRVRTFDILVPRGAKLIGTVLAFNEGPVGDGEPKSAADYPAALVRNSHAIPPFSAEPVAAEPLTGQPDGQHAQRADIASTEMSWTYWQTVEGDS